MASVSRKRNFPFQVGDQCEHKWTVRNYQDTIHPVEIVALHPERGTVSVKCLAFTDEPPQENSDLSGFLPFRGASPNLNYEVGDHIHFKMAGRRVNRRRVDGLVGEEEGIWVQGRVVQYDEKGGRYLIEHFDWDRQDEEEEPRTTRWVPRRHLRMGEN